MSYMFYGAVSFNQPLNGWNVAKVTNMNSMFSTASSFDQRLGDWRLDSVADMGYMFSDASVFNRDLGWCVDPYVDLEYAFGGTRCKSTSCGVGTEEFGTCDEGIQAVFISGIVWACLVVLYCIITHWLNFEGSSEEGEKICTILIFLPVLLVLSCVQFFCWFWWVSKNNNQREVLREAYEQNGCIQQKLIILIILPFLPFISCIYLFW